GAGVRGPECGRCRGGRCMGTGGSPAEEMSRHLATAPATVKQWGHDGILQRHLYSDKNEYLYEPPGDVPPTKCQGTKLADRRRFPAVFPNRSKGVQCEA